MVARILRPFPPESPGFTESSGGPALSPGGRLPDRELAVRRTLVSVLFDPKARTPGLSRALGT